MGRRLMRPGAAPAAPWRYRDADDDYGATATPDWRATDWSRELKRVEIDGTPVNYVDVGSGDEDPVVFVHGLGGQWQNWLENIPRLAQDRRVLALDLPGHGLTPMPDNEKITISGYGRCVDAFCEQLGLSEVELVGNSMGGFVAAEVAIQFPQRVKRLRARLGGRHNERGHAPGADPDLRPRGDRDRHQQRRSPPAPGVAAAGRGTWPWRWWRAIRGA